MGLVSPDFGMGRNRKPLDFIKPPTLSFWNLWGWWDPEAFQTYRAETEQQGRIVARQAAHHEQTLAEWRLKFQWQQASLTSCVAFATAVIGALGHYYSGKSDTRMWERAADFQQRLLQDQLAQVRHDENSLAKWASTFVALVTKFPRK